MSLYLTYNFIFKHKLVMFRCKRVIYWNYIVGHNLTFSSWTLHSENTKDVSQNRNPDKIQFSYLQVFIHKSKKKKLKKKTVNLY